MQECTRRPETKKSVDRKRQCLAEAFKNGSAAHEAAPGAHRYSQFYEDGLISTVFSCIYPHDKCAHCPVTLMHAHGPAPLPHTLSACREPHAPRQAAHRLDFYIATSNVNGNLCFKCPALKGA